MSELTELELAIILFKFLKPYLKIEKDYIELNITELRQFLNPANVVRFSKSE